MIKFAVISPHAPILLPDTGSPADRGRVRRTILSLENLGEKFEKLKIDEIIISSPHQDWGFNVPLFFIAPNFKGKITTYLTNFKSPKDHFVAGKKLAGELDKDKLYALIASGDLSHVLREDGPYGYNPDGPKFDQRLLELLKQRKVSEILNLDEKYPEAADCGLRSFAFALGLLDALNIKIKPEILSYEGPFGVGYLVAKFI